MGGWSEWASGVGEWSGWVEWVGGVSEETGGHGNGIGGEPKQARKCKSQVSAATGIISPNPASQLR